MQQINLAHIVLKSDLTGGPGHSLLTIAQGLSPTEFKQFVLAHERGELLSRLRSSVSEIKVIRRFEISGRFPIPFLITVFRAYLFFRTRRIQIAHFQFHTYRDPVLVAARLARVKTVLHIRGPASDFHISWMSLADRFIFNSRFTESLARLEPELAERSLVLHNAIDAEQFHKQALAHSSEIQAELKIKPQQRIVAAICRIHRAKEIEHFLEVAAILASRSELRLMIVGESQDPDYRQLLGEELVRLELGKRVEFIGHVSNIAGLYPHLAVLLHPAPTEPFGRVILEALATGVPVVGFNSGALPEIIENEVSGLLVPYPDFRSMAEAVTQMLDNLSERERVVRGGKTRLKNFAVENQIEKLTAIYHALV